MYPEGWSSSAEALERKAGEMVVLAVTQPAGRSRSPFHTRYKELADYMAGNRAGQNALRLAESLRPLVEGALHRRFPGLIREGNIPVTRDMWIGKPLRGHLVGFPAVDMKSVGAGGGSIAWVDRGGLLQIGPESAGGVPGPVCYGAGNDHNGMQVDLGAGFTTPLAEQLRGTVGVAATYVNGAYMQAYYGVTPQQSASSGYPVYSVGAGWRDVRLNASLVYAIDARWSLTGALTVASLQSEARDSPIVFEPTAVTALVALSYGF